MRLSLDTLWLLRDGDPDESEIIAAIHDFMFCDMMYSDVRYAPYYDRRLDKIQLLPLKDTIMSDNKSEKRK